MMASSGNFADPCPVLEQLIDVSGGSDDEYDSDDSECDPSFSIEEETNSKASRTSTRKKSKQLLEVVGMKLVVDADVDDAAPNVQTNEHDEKDIPEVLSIINAGKLEKLKVEQCKAYLRKNGLRLTGTKDVLIQRIAEHLEILNGGGEKKYPESSFRVNCKGDACMGDVVMFEQKVYEMYNIASRSSKGPSIGTRTVAGRIVKESYGASKQQHTFTIEVLWSKGEKPLPPLHPLLIKGRNLYRMKTMRQTWDNEGERQKALSEKHARGSLARSNREARVTEKDKRKVPKENRKSRNEGFSVNPSQTNLSSIRSMLAESMVNLSINSREVRVHQHEQEPTCDNPREAAPLQHQQSKTGNMQTKSGAPLQHQQKPVCNPGVPLQHQQSKNRHMQTNSDLFFDHRRQPLQNNYFSQPQLNVDPPASYNIHPSIYRSNHAAASVNKSLNYTSHSSSWDYSRRPTDEMDHYPKVNQLAQARHYTQRQQCRYYAAGRCHYGDSCKYSHERTEECDRRDRERMDHHHSKYSHERTEEFDRRDRERMGHHHSKYPHERTEEFDRWDRERRDHHHRHHDRSARHCR